MRYQYADASAAASNGGASAFSTLRRDSSKANLKRSQEEIGTAVDLVYAVAQAAAQGNWVTSSVQAGGSSLMFRCGDLVAADASGSWASQYAPTRTAMITATAVADAGRQITAWLDRSSRDNAQADADVHFIHAIAPPETQLAVLATQRGNQHATASTNTAIDLSTDLDHSGATIHSTSAAIEKSSAIDSATAWKAYQVALASLDEGAATTAVEKAYQDALAQVTRNSRVAYANLTYTESVAQIGSVAVSITELGSLADSVSCGFTSPTVHGYRHV